MTFNKQLLYNNSQLNLINLLRKRANQILNIINVDNTLQEKLNKMLNKKDKTINKNQEDIGGSRQVDFNRN